MDPWWEAPLRELFAGRRVVIAGAVAAAWSEHVDVLRRLGVEEMLVVATEGRGAGPTPDVPTVVVEPPEGLGLMERLHAGIAALEHPSPEVLDALDRFDPTGDALVVGSFLNTAGHLAGRPFVAHRRPDWVALEDKVVIDAFWDRAGIARQPARVVDLGDAAGAAAELDQGAGTVWAGDARSGFHGGGTRTRWVTDEVTAQRAVDELAPACDRVRVMPFLDGVPCSIHGIVLADGVAVLRPVEMVVLRRDHDFVYAGCATNWDPPSEIRRQMRDVARRAGRQLAAEVAYRGTFTVDGVVTAGGFWPTELNPRFGGGIMTIARAAGLPILLVNDLVVGGHPIGAAAERVERELLQIADERRGGGTWIGALPASVPSVSRPVELRAGGRWGWASAGAAPAGHVIAGDGFVRCTYDPSAVPVGEPTAPLAASFWAFADRQLGTELGPLRPPPDPFATT